METPSISLASSCDQTNPLWHFCGTRCVVDGSWTRTTDVYATHVEHQRVRKEPPVKTIEAFGKLFRALGYKKAQRQVHKIRANYYLVRILPLPKIPLDDAPAAPSPAPNPGPAPAPAASAPAMLSFETLQQELGAFAPGRMNFQISGWSDPVNQPTLVAEARAKMAEVAAVAAAAKRAQLDKQAARRKERAADGQAEYDRVARLALMNPEELIIKWADAEAEQREENARWNKEKAAQQEEDDRWVAEMSRDPVDADEVPA